MTSWAEAISDALVLAPDRLATVRAEAQAAQAGSGWRSILGLPEPSPTLSRALACLFSTIDSARTSAGTVESKPVDVAVIDELERDAGAPGLEALARRVLRSMLEQRQARQTLGS